MKEQGKEWRFPNLTGADFEVLAESARGACNAAVQQSFSKSPAHQQAPKQVRVDTCGMSLVIVLLAIRWVNMIFELVRTD